MQADAVGSEASSRRRYPAVERLLAERQRYRRALAAALIAVQPEGAHMSWYVREDGTVADLDGDCPVEDDD